MLKNFSRRLRRRKRVEIPQFFDSRSVDGPPLEGSPPQIPMMPTQKIVIFPVENRPLTYSWRLSRLVVFKKVLVKSLNYLGYRVDCHFLEIFGITFIKELKINILVNQCVKKFHPL